jgi:hypothetical protein
VAVLLAVLILGAFTTGCGSSAPAASTSLPLSKAKVSVVEGLPVPAQAKLVVNHQQQHYAEYGLVGVPISAANHWYAKELPSGKTWNNWTWVSPTGPGCLNLFHSKGTNRTWLRGSSMLMLNTTTAAVGTGIVIEVLPKPSPGFPVC